MKNEQGHSEQIYARKSIVKASVTEALWLVLKGLKRTYEKWGGVYSQYEGPGKDICVRKDSVL